MLVNNMREVLEFIAGLRSGGKAPAAWSHSALDNANTCPHKHFMTRVSKAVKEDWGDAAAYGDWVHKSFENRIKSRRALPSDLRQHESMLEKIASAPGTVTPELALTFTDELKPTGWFSKDAWWRIKIDVDIVSPDGRAARDLDWKTGKQKDDHSQLELTAMARFVANPELVTVDTAYVWLKPGTVTRATYNVDHAILLWNEYLPRIEEYMQYFINGHWPKRPSGLCRGWCPVTTCEHWQPKPER